MEQWNIDGGTVWRKSGTVEQSWWNSVVEQWNIDGGTVWWKSGTVMVEQCGGTVMVEQCNVTVMVEQCGGTVKQSWWNSVVVQWNIDGGTVC